VPAGHRRRSRARGSTAGLTITNTTPATVTAVALEWNLRVPAASKVSKTLTIKFYDAATEPLADLSAAAATPATTKQSLIAQFQSAQTTEQAAAADADQQACIHTVRGVALANLQGPAPLSAVISHEIRAVQSRLAALKAYGIGQ
jgi:hypothetical protein